MGKGDKKTKKGKMIMGSYGITRKSKSSKRYIASRARAKEPLKKLAITDLAVEAGIVAEETKVKKETKKVAEKPVAEKKAKKPATKKTEDSTDTTESAE